MRIGVNIPGRGEISASTVAESGATVARLVAYPDYDATRYLCDLAARGIQPLVILASESFAGDVDSALTYYRRLYGDVPGAAFQVGNESDQAGSESSWHQSHAQVNDLLRRARRTLGDRATIIAPGLVSGDPRWVDGLDLSVADFYAVHPYGQRAARGWPHPEWGFGDVLDLLAAYRDHAGDTPLWVTEFGLTSRDYDEAFRADYLTRMYGTLAASGLVEVACWFALHDFDGFGLLKADGERMPGWYALRGVAGVPDSVATAPASEPPAFVLGFADIATRYPDLVGEPLENERGGIVGFSQQRTTRGLLTFADLRSGRAFTFYEDATGTRWRYVEESGEMVAA